MSRKHRTGIKLRPVESEPPHPPHYRVKLDKDGKPYIITVWNKRLDIMSPLFPQILPILDCGFRGCQVDLIEGQEELNTLFAN